MKLINKNKIFGIFNLLDIIIIALLLIIVLPALHYYIKINDKGFLEQQDVETYAKLKKYKMLGSSLYRRQAIIETHVSFKALTEEQLKEIKVGDKEILPDKEVIAEILWIGRPEPNYFIVNLGCSENLFVRTEPDGLFSLPAKMRLKGNISDYFEYKKLRLRKFNFFEFNSGRYKVEFTIEIPYEELSS